MKTLKVGSRESKLAVIQAEMVMDAIHSFDPELSLELVTMKTTGDKILDKTLDKIGGKGLFVKELDKALEERAVDMTVHSLKDMPMELTSGLPVTAYSRRENPRDVLILSANTDKLDPQKPIGCASARRRIQLQRLFPEMKIEPIRGNVQTRLRKLDEGQYSALVLAAAGVHRLGLEHRISRVFSTEEILPAAGQGIIAVQTRAGEDTEFLSLFRDRTSEICALAERSFVRTLGGGCSSPVAAYAEIKDDRLLLTGLYVNADETVVLRDSLFGAPEQAEALGEELAKKMQKQAEKSCGKVVLVGAGPGDSGLLTVKGMKMLLAAEVVVYDRLVGPDILAIMPEKAEKINVGKRSSHHPVPQEEINRILLDKALEGKLVVRLKGGDCFLFGRGGEELELLREHGVPFEVVPGVTSALSAPAYAGIPVTHRDFCSSIHIVTGHAKKGSELHIDYEALTRMGGTIVFMMSVTSLGELMDGLCGAGMRADMPAAVVERGTLPGQRKLVANISTLAQRAKEADIQSPAVIVVGEVCTLSDEFDWFGGLPLHGARVVVTRPKERAGTLSDELRAVGAEVISYPCIRTEELDSESAKEKLSSLADYQWLVLTSPAGAVSLFRLLSEMGLDARALGRVKLAAIGAGTAGELARHGLRADFVPGIYDAAHLAAGLAAVAFPGERALILRAETGTPELTAGLDAAGIGYDDIAVYRTHYLSENSEEVASKLTAGEIDYVTFTSASTVTGFVQSLPDVDVTHIKGVCIGKSTQREAQKYGIPTITAQNATISQLVQAIVMDRSGK